MVKLIKDAFGIEGEILLQKFDKEWQEFIDLEGNAVAEDKARHVINLLWRSVVSRGGNLTYNGDPRVGKWTSENLKMSNFPWVAPPPPILGQTIDRGITLSWAGFRQIIRFFINLAWYKILILVQSSVFIDRLRVMLRYMHSYLTLLMTKYTATDSNNLKCHALLAALYFPLESTSHSVLLLTHFFHHGNLHSSQCQIFRFCIIISRT